MFRTDRRKHSVPARNASSYLSPTLSEPRRPFILLILLILLSATGLRAQWTQTATGLVPTPSGFGGGAITYSSGIVWAGAAELYLSMDDGLTWIKRSVPYEPTEFIRHLDFYDDSTGLLAASTGETWLTKDQAVTWTKIRSTQSNWAARFINSPQNIIIAGASSGVIELSRDGGQSWIWSRVGTHVPFVEPLLDGSAYALIATTDSRSAAHLWHSDANGTGWIKSRDSVGFDSYTFAVDHCSPERVYVANEDAGQAVFNTNGFSEIYVTSNSGEDWKITYSVAGKDINGAISVSSNAVYLQRLNGGVLRSTDFGGTWQTIGGPSADYDSRLLCAVTDNLIVAADAQGNIWRTINSGGDSVQGEIRLLSIRTSPDILFLGDTLLPCDPPTVDSLSIRSTFCSDPPRIVSAVIEGDHPGDFTIVSDVPEILTGIDSLAFELTPRGNGERRANLRITLEDSSTIIIPMRGYGKGVTEQSIATASGGTDTLGAVVYLPINYNRAGAETGVSMQVSFTSDQLEFVDAYDLAGLSVALPGNDPKRHQLVFPVIVTSPELIGHAAFRVYSGDEACMPVVFDSISIISRSPPCAFSINPSMNAEICVPNDCVAWRVSDYLRHGNLPQLNVILTGDDLLFTSDVNFGDVKIRVVNTLGVTEASHSGELRNDRPVRFSVRGVPSGLYFIEVQSALGRRTLKKVIQR